MTYIPDEGEVYVSIPLRMLNQAKDVLLECGEDLEAAMALNSARQTASEIRRYHRDIEPARAAIRLSSELEAAIYNSKATT